MRRTFGLYVQTGYHDTMTPMPQILASVNTQTNGIGSVEIDGRTMSIPCKVGHVGIT